jgi:type IV secretory pathway VirB2 component (pilin)
MSTKVYSDLITLAAGGAAWTLAIVPVKSVGAFCANGDGPANKMLAMILGVGIAYYATPILSFVLGWTTPYQKVRGVALALGAAQLTDGVTHMWFPTFYNSDHEVGILCASNIFYGAGLLGIFSAYQ